MQVNGQGGGVLYMGEGEATSTEVGRGRRSRLRTWDGVGR